jgi:hypothetical protein
MSRKHKAQYSVFLWEDGHGNHDVAASCKKCDERVGYPHYEDEQHPILKERQVNKAVRELYNKEATDANQS